MKKWHWLLIFLTATNCIYANTAVLVYSVSLQTNPWLVDSDQNAMTIAGAKSNFKMQAALIVDMDTDTFTTVAPDASQLPVLILFGKDSDGTAVNYILTGDANSVRFEMVKMPDVKTIRTFAKAIWYFGDFSWSMTTAGEVGAFGELVPTVISNGSTAKVAVPKTLKGVGTLQKGLNPPFTAGVGDGLLTAALNTTITKQVNAGGNGTVQAAVALIQKKKGPTPNPLLWIVRPLQIPAGGYSHTMQCGEVDGANSLIQYKFVCVDNPSISSGWQESTSYTVSVGGPHSYRWYAIAKDVFGHTTGNGNTIWVKQ